MKAPLNFEEYLKKGIIKRKIPDKPRAIDLIKESKRKFNSLKLIIDKIGIFDDNANDIVEYCYDIIINLVRSRMMLEGFSSSGKGAHEAEIAYLRKLNLSEVDVKMANQLRYFRNGIMYYGKRFDSEYAKKIIKFLNKIKKNLEK
jgi:putative IMPACT (imprinted ancient) family translation regulator